MKDELVLYVKKYFKEGKQLGIGYGIDNVTDLGTFTEFDNWDLDYIAIFFRNKIGRVFKNFKDSDSEIELYRDGTIVLKTGLSLEELTTFAELLSKNNEPNQISHTGFD